jgi:hypothetical protein
VPNMGGKETLSSEFSFNFPTKCTNNKYCIIATSLPRVSACHCHLQKVQTKPPFIVNCTTSINFTKSYELWTKFLFFTWKRYVNLPLYFGHTCVSFIACNYILYIVSFVSKYFTIWHMYGLKDYGYISYIVFKYILCVFNFLYLHYSKCGLWRWT